MKSIARLLIAALVLSLTGVAQAAKDPGIEMSKGVVNGLQPLEPSRISPYEKFYHVGDAQVFVTLPDGFVDNGRVKIFVSEDNAPRQALELKEQEQPKDIYALDSHHYVVVTTDTAQELHYYVLPL